MNLNNILPNLEAYFRSKREIDFAYLFGSLATGRDGPLSDVDVAFFLNGKRSNFFKTRLTVITDLMDLFNRNEIDAIPLNDASPLLRFKVIKNGCLLFQKNKSQRINFEIKSSFEYLDFKPLLDRYFKYLAQRIKGGECMIDREIIEVRLSKINEYIKLLEDISKISLEEFRNDPKEYMFVEHCLQLAIECSLDIGAHLISALNLRRFETYKDIFIILGEAKILPGNLVKRLIPMVGFRNILIHEYLNVDLEEVYQSAQEGIEDLREFSRYILETLEKEGDSH